MPRPRALFVAPMLPARSGNGLAMRLGLFLEALAGVAAVDLVVIPVAGGRPADAGYVSSLGVNLTIIGVDEGPDTHFRLLSRITDPALRLQAFAQYGKPSLSSLLSSATLQRFGQLAERHSYQLVHIGRSYMAPLVPELAASVPVTLDLDEDDRTSFASRAVFARRERDAFRAAWLVQEGIACDALIAQVAGRCSRVFVASEDEATSLRRRHRGLTIEPIGNAVELPQRAHRHDDGHTLLFVGSFGYEPNVDGIVWFVEKVMPLLRAKIEKFTLVIAGADPPATVCALARHPGIRVLGFVEDVSQLYARATLAVAPMQAGGGTRIKVLEAAAHGLASVASLQAAAGLFTARRPWGWICSTPAEFAEACIEGLTDRTKRRRLGLAGRRAVAAGHGRSTVLRRLAQTFRGCLDTASSDLSGKPSSSQEVSKHELQP